MPNLKTDGVALNRRDLIKVALTSGGALTVAMAIPGCANFRQNQLTDEGAWEANAWLEIRPDNSVIFTLDRVEMGQGSYTGLVTLLAEELEISPSAIEVEFAGAQKSYRNPDYGLQLTGGSNSLATSWQRIRKAGAGARLLLVKAAAEVLGVSVDNLFCEDGFVRVKGANKSIAYGTLCRLASKQNLPVEITLKTAKNFRYIGKQNKRLDALQKVTGTAQYGVDVEIDDMKYAVLVRPPQFGSTLVKYNQTAILGMPGVLAVTETSRGVAIVAEKYWSARKAQAALDIVWREDAGAPKSSEEITRQYHLAANENSSSSVRSEGSGDKAFLNASSILDLEYSAPFLAHATMEPVNCVARVTDGHAEIWTGTQAPDIAQVAVAKVTNVDLSDVVIHNQFLGGGFGRRLSQEFIAEAAEISYLTGHAVKLIWSREEDIRHDLYRPASFHKVRIALDAQGKPLAWDHNIIVPKIMDWYVWDASPAMFPWAPEFMYPVLGHAGLLTEGTPVTPADTSPYEGAHDFPYKVPSIDVRHTKVDAGVPISYWRSVGHSFNAFVVESAISEMANAAGMDELDYRLSYLDRSSRTANVLRVVAEKGGWGKDTPEGVYQGLAAHKSFGSYVAQLVELKIEYGEIRLLRVVSVLDCGLVVNPDIVTMQIESGVIFGASAAMFGEITLENGQVLQSNFHDYPVMRMNHMPVLETHIVESDVSPTGVGEPGVPPIAPAMASALFRATGKRFRSLPLKLT